MNTESNISCALLAPVSGLTNSQEKAKHFWNKIPCKSATLFLILKRVDSMLSTGAFGKQDRPLLVITGTLYELLLKSVPRQIFSNIN